MELKISKLDLKKKLEEYVNEEITLEELQDWELHMSRIDAEPDDWEGDDSFINEVMRGNICMSDIDGLSIDKTKEIIKLLELNKSTKELIEELYALKWKKK